MNAVEIDVSKGKSMVAAMRPFGEVVATPFEVLHSENDLRKLADLLKQLPGETRVYFKSLRNSKTIEKFLKYFYRRRSNRGRCCSHSKRVPGANLDHYLFLSISYW